MDESALTAGDGATGDALVARLHDLARAIPPLEIAELWIFPPLAELEKSAEFLLCTRFRDGERRTLYSARLHGANGTRSQLVVEHGSVPAGRVPRLVERLQRRLGGDDQPFHVVIDGRERRWRELLEERADPDRAWNGPLLGTHGNGAAANGHGPA